MSVPSPAMLDGRGIEGGINSIERGKGEETV